MFDLRMMEVDGSTNGRSNWSTEETTIHLFIKQVAKFGRVKILEWPVLILVDRQGSHNGSEWLTLVKKKNFQAVPSHCN